ncbi:hypothetical protein PUN28_016289 [Cardiocondyla obscurior]|uniref:Uncharacterized protein n=1 Tax=Cardiocondyla obscurior TaxID=286306 RepID=A0AAW2ERW5_9HYME
MTQAQTKTLREPWRTFVTCTHVCIHVHVIEEKKKKNAFMSPDMLYLSPCVNTSRLISRGISRINHGGTCVACVLDVRGCTRARAKTRSLKTPSSTTCSVRTATSRTTSVLLPPEAVAASTPVLRTRVLLRATAHARGTPALCFAACGAWAGLSSLLHDDGQLLQVTALCFAIVPY